MLTEEVHDAAKNNRTTTMEVNDTAKNDTENPTFLLLKLVLGALWHRAA